MAASPISTSVVPLGFPQGRESRIVALGGGTGLPAVLRGLLRTCEGAHASPPITGIVTVMDDGGSSGTLRDAMGMLPPGDIRNCLGALVEHPSRLAAILHDRSRDADAACGHPVGNLLLAALNGVHGNFLEAIETLGEMMGVSGRVLPATLDDVHLRARFADGSEVEGETAIARRGTRIQQVRLTADACPGPGVIEALADADLVVVGPGSLYTSSLPVLLVDHVAETMARLRVPKVYVANLMTQPGETDGFTLADHLAALRDNTGHDLFDYVLVNRRPLSALALARYAEQGAQPVLYDARQPWTCRTRVVTGDIAITAPDGTVRHNPVALGFALRALARRRRAAAIAAA